MASTIAQQMQYREKTYGSPEPEGAWQHVFIPADAYQIRKEAFTAGGKFTIASPTDWKIPLAYVAGISRLVKSYLSMHQFAEVDAIQNTRRREADIAKHTELSLWDAA